MDELVGLAADALAPAAAFPAEEIQVTLADSLRNEGFSLGSGVAIPHSELADLKKTLVCVVTLRQPIRFPTIDGKPLDVFFFILSRADPHAHLLLLARLARLTRSRTFLDGLRRAHTPDAVLELVRAAEARHQPLPGEIQPVFAVASHALCLVSLEGEAVLDALLIDLVDQGFGSACVLEARSLHEAATREVPLFADFRDLFGDPGGRRVLILEVEADHVDALVETVKRVSEEHRAREVRLSVLPIERRWASPTVVEDDRASGGH